MGTKLTNRDEVAQIVRNSTDRMAAKYPSFNGLPSHAYAAGYLESMVTNMLLELPKAKQQFYINLLTGVK
jgi:hypothetical protein